MNEQWKPITDFEGYYEVSNRGRIRSLSRVIERGNPRSMGSYQAHIEGRTLRTFTSTPGIGVARVTLSKNSHPSHHRVYDLVKDAFGSVDVRVAIFLGEAVDLGELAANPAMEKRTRRVRKVAPPPSLVDKAINFFQRLASGLKSEAARGRA